MSGDTVVRRARQPAPGSLQAYRARRLVLLQQTRAALAAHPVPPCETLRAPQLSTLKLETRGTDLVDAAGRTVIMRGVNAGGRSKLPPYFPFALTKAQLADPAAFDEAAGHYLDRIVAWGLNVIRMPFMWQALEPTRGHFNDDYLQKLGRIIDLAAARGIRVVVDCHQDAFANVYGGDGFPDWAVQGHHHYPPVYSAEMWALGYFINPALRRSFTRFWHNADGLQNEFERMWTHVAQRLAGKKNVVGFEIINEPDAGTQRPKVWERTVLTPFYTRMAEVVHRAASGALVFLDASAMDGQRAKTDLERPAGKHLVFAPHYYDGIRLAGGYLPLLRPLASLFGDKNPAASLGQWRAKGAAWKMPVFVGELGVAPKAYDSARYVRHTFDGLDDQLLGGAFWEYSDAPTDFHHEGMSLVDAHGHETHLVAECVRAYPAAVAGKLDGFFYNAGARVGRLRLTPADHGVTEIRLPRRIAPAGIEVACSGDEGRLHWCYDKAGQRLLVRVDGTEPIDIFFGSRPNLTV